MQKGQLVAIVGMGATLPGSRDLENFWQHVAAGDNLVRPVDPVRWTLAPDLAIGPHKALPDKVFSTSAGLLLPEALNDDRLQQVDSSWLICDDTVKLALITAIKALEKISFAQVNRQKCGVILGNIALPTVGASLLADHYIGDKFTAGLCKELGLPIPAATAANPAYRYATALPALAIASHFGFGGNVFTMDAACSSALYAIHHAVEELQSGRLDMVVTGGMAMPDPLFTQMGFSQLTALSPSGQCAPFDYKGDGLVVGEGAAFVVLKRLADAEAQGDKILAVIRGMGLSNDLGGSHLAPAEDGQILAMNQAYDEAGLHPWDMQLIECHATGTQLGDAVEFNSLRQVWQGAPKERGAVIGSVKSNIGHLLTGAGGAALIKVLLAMEKGLLPPTANFERPGEKIKLAESPFTVLSQARPWTDPIKRAAVSGFGFGGINAHLVLEQYHREVSAIPRPAPVAERPVAIVAMASETAASMAEVKVPLGRYKIPPVELAEALPQQLLMLNIASEAINKVPLSVPSDKRGVFIGISLDLTTSNYHLRWKLRQQLHDWYQGQLSEDQVQQILDRLSPPLNANRTLGGLGSIVASRIAREYKVAGPAYALQSEELSGFTALEAAYRAVAGGRLDWALAGAVDVQSDSRLSAVCHEQGLDNLGDGAVAFVLRPLHEAMAAGEPILATIGDFTATVQPAAQRPTPCYGGTEPLLKIKAAIEAMQKRDNPLPEAALRQVVVNCGSTLGEFGQLIVRESPEAAPRRPEKPALLVVSGDDTNELNAKTQELWQLAVSGKSLPEVASCYYCDHDYQPEKQHIVAFLAKDIGELQHLVSMALDCDLHSLGQIAPGRIFYHEQLLPGKVAFVLPGSGNHYVGMGKQLTQAFPTVVGGMAARYGSLAGQFCPEILWEGTKKELDNNHSAMILGQVSCGCLGWAVMTHLGLTPRAGIGYSLGETASLFASGTWTERALMEARVKASDLFTTELAGPCYAAARHFGQPAGSTVDWTLGVVNRPAATVRQYLAGRSHVYLLIVNTYDECVIGGERSAVQALVADLKAHYVEVHGVTSVHCEVTNEVYQAYHDLHLLKTTPDPEVAIYSPAWGRAYEPTTAQAALSVTEQAVYGLDYPKLINQAFSDGFDKFIELGPGRSCTRMIDKILAEKPHLATAIMVEGDEWAALMASCALLVAEHLPLDLKKLLVGELPKKANKFGEITVPAHHSVDWPANIPEIPANIQKYEVEVMPQNFAPVVPTFDFTNDIMAMSTTQAAAHSAYLQCAQQMEALIAQQANMEAMMGQLNGPASPAYMPNVVPAATVPALSIQIPAEVPTSLTREQCLAYAVGKIGHVLGPKYAEIDNFPTRVRLPDEPLMLVDRITRIEAEPLSMSHGRLVTEHDVLQNGWYLDGGRIPTAIAVEAGQADLFLSGYLGIDLETRGLAVYRLLDAVVTFHSELPAAGEVIVYDIQIEKFFRQGDVWLFKFHFEATVNGQPLLSMTDGCAGFFTEAALAAGKGIVARPLDLKAETKGYPADWQQLVPMEKGQSLSELQVEALRRGDLAAAFGPEFAGLLIKKPYTIPGGKMHLVDWVETIDQEGGRFGHGLIRGQARIHGNEWFLTCHFVDDQVMPGTLMYECCLHTLRIFLLRMGWVGEEGQVTSTPVVGVSSRLRCRGQVKSTTRLVTYEIHLKEIGYNPAPYVLADALMYADGRPIVEIGNMSLQLNGLTLAGLKELWSRGCTSQTVTTKEPPRFTYEQILAYSNGNPSECFGEPYKVFDLGQKRKLARLPRPPFQLVDRVLEVTGEPFVMKAPASCKTEFDIHHDDWFFKENRQSEMPFAILLEIALQPCGFLAAYVGSGLTSEKDLHFRNLGGDAKMLKPLRAGDYTLTVDAVMTAVAASGGMIIQHFTFKVYQGNDLVYDGKTYFGFFSDEALAEQIGIREAKLYEVTAAEKGQSEHFAVPTAAPMPTSKWQMVRDVIEWLPNGGTFGQGFIRGTIPVEDDRWFFKAHFFEDPVWPGSLGLEAFLQLLKVALLRKTGRTNGEFTTIALGQKHEWVYRGQVLPKDSLVTVEAVIKEFNAAAGTLKADGWLSVDGRHIYQMKDFEIGVR